MLRANCISKTSLFCSTPFKNTNIQSFIKRNTLFISFQKNKRYHKKFQLSRTVCFSFCKQKQSQTTQEKQTKLRIEYAQLCGTFLQKQKLEQAIQNGEKALKLYHNDQDKPKVIAQKLQLLYRLGRCYVQQQKFVQAKKLLLYFDQLQQKRNIDQKPMYRGFVYRMIAEICEELPDKQNLLKYRKKVMQFTLNNKQNILQILSNAQKQQKQKQINNKQSTSTQSAQQIEKKEKK